jgi:hypothetical protein
MELPDDRTFDRTMDRFLGEHPAATTADERDRPRP